MLLELKGRFCAGRGVEIGPGKSPYCDRTNITVNVTSGAVVLRGPDSNGLSSGTNGINFTGAVLDEEHGSRASQPRRLLR